VVLVAPGGRLVSGQGQGILLAEGDLEVGDGVEFFGVVVVNGRLQLTGSGSGLTGLVLVRSAPTDTSNLTGTGSVIHRSSCALERAAGDASVVQPILTRSWMQF